MYIIYYLLKKYILYKIKVGRAVRSFAWVLSLGRPLLGLRPPPTRFFFHKALTRLGKKNRAVGRAFRSHAWLLSVGWALLGLSACAGSIFFPSQGAGAPCEGKKISPSGERFGLSHDMLSLGRPLLGLRPPPTRFFSSSYSKKKVKYHEVT